MILSTQVTHRLEYHLCFGINGACHPPALRVIQTNLMEILPPSLLRLGIALLQIFQLYLEANRRSLIRGYLALLLSAAPPALLPMKQRNKSTVVFGVKKEHYSRP